MKGFSRHRHIAGHVCCSGVWNCRHTSVSEGQTNRLWFWFSFIFTFPTVLSSCSSAIESLAFLLAQMWASYGPRAICGPWSFLNWSAELEEMISIVGETHETQKPKLLKETFCSNFALVLFQLAPKQHVFYLSNSRFLTSYEVAQAKRPIHLCPSTVRSRAFSRSTGTSITQPQLRPSSLWVKPFCSIPFQCSFI